MLGENCKLIGTAALPFTSLYSAVVTSATITAPSATTTEPTGNGIYDMTQNHVPLNNAAIAFFGGNANNDTFTARVTGWRRVGTLWVPIPLLAISGLLGNHNGVSAAAVTNLQFFADTITIDTAFTAAYEVINPGSDQIAMVKVDMAGCEKLQVQVAKGTAAGIAAMAAGF